MGKKTDRICDASEAKPCPFCGEQPRLRPWHGGAKTKRMIGCPWPGCYVQPAVTGPTPGVALARWNERSDERMREAKQFVHSFFNHKPEGSA